MASTLAYTARAPGYAAPGPSPVPMGLATGASLLLLPLLVVATVRLADPRSAIAARVVAVETVLIAAGQMGLSIAVVRKWRDTTVVRALIPALLAGLVVSAGDVAALRFAFDTDPTTA